MKCNAFRGGNCKSTVSEVHTDQGGHHRSRSQAVRTKLGTFCRSFTQGFLLSIYESYAPRHCSICLSALLLLKIAAGQLDVAIHRLRLKAYLAFASSFL